MKHKMLSVVIFLLGLGTSCDLPPLIVLFNNTGRNLTVHADKKAYSVKQYTAVEIDFPGNEQTLRIDAGSMIVQYNIQYPPKEYAYGRGFRAYVINFQIESDLKIYVVKTEIPMPVKVVPPQPLGFPLQPKS